ncbi:MAG: hypothetical protein LBQ77_08510 [Treponema sp.]|jgi:hypothetical protein|nr:hypothetical protein [Treponema sp.]
MIKKVVPLIIVILSAALAAFLIIIFRFIVPVESSPLPRYFFSWHLNQGIFEFTQLYPAIALTALLIPASVLYRSDSISFAILKWHLISALFSAVLYTVLVLLVGPLSSDALDSMRVHSIVFKRSLEQAQSFIAEKDWESAARPLAMCAKIWHKNEEVQVLLKEISIRRGTVYRAPEQDYTAAVVPPGERVPVNAAEAIRMAEEAFNKGLYFDSHWLATLGARIARPGSTESYKATLLASQAWNMIDSSDISIQNQARQELYQQKIDGYTALITEDWVHAYYVFKTLSNTYPNDPDVQRFLHMSEQALVHKAFFIDELEQRVGDILTGVVLSLPVSAIITQEYPTDPSSSDRAVLYIDSLSTFSDSSFGTHASFEVFEEDQGISQYTVTAPYVKMMPITLEGRAQTLVLLQALDRFHPEQRWNPVWAGAEQPYERSIILFDLPYDDLLILAKLQRGMDNLSITDILTVARSFARYGVPSKVFSAELLYSFVDSLCFIILSIFALGIGFHFKVHARVAFLLFPLLIAVSITVLYECINLFRSLLNLLCMLALNTYSFPISCAIFGIGIVVILLISLFTVVKQ